MLSKCLRMKNAKNKYGRKWKIILACKCHSAFITLSNSIDGTNDSEMLVV